MQMDELKSKKIWICWNWGTRKGNRTKVPISAYGTSTGTDEPHAHTWVTYDEVIKSAKEHGYDGIIQRLYEDNVEGKITDERFRKLDAGYEEEQRELTIRVHELREQLAASAENVANTDDFLAIVRKYTDIQELTPEIIREFVEKVYVYQPERVEGHKVQHIKIVWNCIGEFSLPEKKNGTAD